MNEPHEGLPVIEPRRLKAPQEDGGILALPPLNEAGRLLEHNRRVLSSAAFDVLGRPLDELRAEARLAVLKEVEEYFRGTGAAVGALGDRSSLVLAGHQPDLFHPGVWVKNFALNGLAKKHGFTPVNLIVDNDTLKSAACHVPAGQDSDPASVRLASVPFDRWEREVPYEEHAVRDEPLFATFPDRVAERLGGWGLKPMLPAYWQEVRAQASRTKLLGERLAAARRAVERRWGCANLELPVSRLSRTEPFARFAGHLLLNLPRYHRIHNESLQAYRKLYRLRSRHHPVPDLAADGDWLEAPFWAWRADHPQRSRLLVRQTPDRLELRVGPEAWPALPLHPSSFILHPLSQLQTQGYRLRPRALTTTLFARLFVADLFIHGIGGAKYDELTDKIIRRFYGLEPPAYLVLSATLRLPLPAFPTRPDDCRRLGRLLRDLRYNPQRHLDGEGLDPELATLAAEKQSWIAREPANRHERRERFQRLRGLTERLQKPLSVKQQGFQEQLQRCEDELAANAVLRRRDYAFCLFPEDVLRGFCVRFLNG